MILAEKIKAVAKQHGKTISGMAAEMGIAQTHLSRTINNPRITLADLEKISLLIGCSVNDFFADEEERPQIVCPYCGRPIKINVEQ